jgi:ABC-type transporter Mla MlaB component
MFAKFFARFLDLVAARVAGLLPIDNVCKHIAGHVNVVRVSEVVCDLLDLSEIEANIATKVHVTASDVAEHIDTRDLADYLDSDDIAKKAADEIDITAVAKKVEKNRDFVKAVAEEIGLSDLAGELDYASLSRELELDYEEIAGNLDSEAIAAEVQIDMEEIASNLNMSDVASEISMSDLADEISLSDLASEINYEELAKALLSQFAVTHAKANAVEMRPAGT